MAELDFISKFSGEEIDNILDKSQELLNKGYTFSGVATPETDPGTPSIKVFYLTTTAGKYANFDNITVESGKLTVLLYNGSMWQNQVLDLPKEANVVHVDYSLLGTHLSDANFNKIWNAKGLVISGNDSIPMIFTRGRSNSERTGFYAFSDSSTMVYMALLASTKKLNLLTSWPFNSGSVIYNATQTLTDTQKQQARTNIGVQSADELIEDADFIAQLKTKLGIA